MSAIETDGLTKEYGSTTAVSGLDLVVEPGEVYGFLGPNGAGKSTTIALLLDYVRPTSGRARIFGLDAQRDAVEISRCVGVLPEGCELYERLSGYRHLAFAIDAMDASDDPDDLLVRVGLDGASRRPVGEYSTGMVQRLALALALVGEPTLLLLDEPSSGMDPNGIRLLRGIVEEEHERGTTVFFSSHVLEQVEAVCDRVGILVDGELAVSGGLDELQADLGPSIRLSIDVERVSTELEGSLSSMPSVTALRIPSPSDGRSAGAGTRIEVSLDDERARAAILRAVEEHTTVRDFSTERWSLETLFREHATGER